MRGSMTVQARAQAVAPPITIHDCQLPCCLAAQAAVEEHCSQPQPQAQAATAAPEDPAARAAEPPAAAEAPGQKRKAAEKPEEDESAAKRTATPAAAAGDGTNFALSDIKRVDVRCSSPWKSGESTLPVNTCASCCLTIHAKNAEGTYEVEWCEQANKTKFSVSLATNRLEATGVVAISSICRSFKKWPKPGDSVCTGSSWARCW